MGQTTIGWSKIQNPYKTKTDNSPYTRNVPLEYKGFGLTKEPDHLLWTITPLDGSRTPTQLRGRWTSSELAQQFIDIYLEVKKTNKKKKGEAVDDAYGS